MKKSKQLPCEIPVFSAYHYQICGMVPALTNPSGYNWYLNECISLSCTDKFFSDFDTNGLLIDNSCFVENPYLNITDVREIGDWDSIIEMIKTAINNNEYVYFCGADDYYITGKSNYGENHMSHDGLIYGFNDDKAELSLLAYNSNWVCKAFQASYSSFKNSLHNIINDKKIWYGYFSFIKSKKEYIPLDLYQIRNQLNDYLNSDLKRYPYTSPGKKTGMVIYDYIYKLFELVSERYISNESLDWRLLRVLWEHKKCMLDRIKSIEVLTNNNDFFSSNYEQVVSIANHARMVYARNNIRPDIDLLRLITSDLHEIQKKEKVLLIEVETLLSKTLESL